MQKGPGGPKLSANQLPGIQKSFGGPSISSTNLPTSGQPQNRSIGNPNSYGQQPSLAAGSSRTAPILQRPGGLAPLQNHGMQNSSSIPPDSASSPGVFQRESPLQGQKTASPMGLVPAQSGFGPLPTNNASGRKISSLTNPLGMPPRPIGSSPGLRTPIPSSLPHRSGSDTVSLDATQSHQRVLKPLPAATASLHPPNTTPLPPRVSTPLQPSISGQHGVSLHPSNTTVLPQVSTPTQPPVVRQSRPQVSMPSQRPAARSSNTNQIRAPVPTPLLDGGPSLNPSDTTQLPSQTSMPSQRPAARLSGTNQLRAPVSTPLLNAPSLNPLDTTQLQPQVSVALQQGHHHLQIPGSAPLRSPARASTPSHPPGTISSSLLSSSGLATPLQQPLASPSTRVSLKAPLAPPAIRPPVGLSIQPPSLAGTILPRHSVAGKQQILVSPPTYPSHQTPAHSSQSSSLKVPFQGDDQSLAALNLLRHVFDVVASNWQQQQPARHKHIGPEHSKTHKQGKPMHAQPHHERPLNVKSNVQYAVPPSTTAMPAGVISPVDELDGELAKMFDESVDVATRKEIRKSLQLDGELANMFDERMEEATRKEIRKSLQQHAVPPYIQQEILRRISSRQSGAIADLNGELAKLFDESVDEATKKEIRKSLQLDGELANMFDESMEEATRKEIRKSLQQQAVPPHIQQEILRRISSRQFGAIDDLDGELAKLFDESVDEATKKEIRKSLQLDGELANMFDESMEEATRKEIRKSLQQQAVPPNIQQEILRRISSRQSGAIADLDGEPTGMFDESMDETARKEMRKSLQQQAVAPYIQPQEILRRISSRQFGTIDDLGGEVAKMFDENVDAATRQELRKSLQHQAVEFYTHPSPEILQGISNSQSGAVDNLDGELEKMFDETVDEGTRKEIRKSLQQQGDASGQKSESSDSEYSEAHALHENVLSDLLLPDRTELHSSSSSDDEHLAHDDVRFPTTDKYEEVDHRHEETPLIQGTGIRKSLLIPVGEPRSSMVSSLAPRQSMLGQQPRASISLGPQPRGSIPSQKGAFEREPANASLFQGADVDAPSSPQLQGNYDLDREVAARSDQRPSRKTLLRDSSEMPQSSKAMDAAHQKKEILNQILPRPSISPYTPSLAKEDDADRQRKKSLDRILPRPSYHVSLGAEGMSQSRPDIEPRTSSIDPPSGYKIQLAGKGPAFYSDPYRRFSCPPTCFRPSYLTAEMLRYIKAYQHANFDALDSNSSHPHYKGF